MKKYLAAALLVSILSVAAFGSAQARQMGNQMFIPPAPPMPGHSDNRGNPHSGCHGANAPGTWRIVQFKGQPARCYCAGAADESLPNSCCPGQPPEPCKRNDNNDHGH
ncbi:MAG: hypothetical protein K8R48_02195 [Alphaproteobacteria bacterium]|nr:hypothetical protein [Alphaproteobacteria bacterium]